ncbi:MAG TPA: VWA domain-containing protein [Vicinamibacterales bacterium]|nr:VWA domain-containing protein [Vicinamibacterales bacterium]
MTWRSCATACAAACAAAFGASVLSAQQPTFSSRLEAVRVDALVSEGGKPVRGLRPGDFVVLDNGVPQTVDLASFETLPVNVILALDHSNSVTGDRLAQLQEAARTVLRALAPRDQAALVTFSHRVALPQALTRDSGSVIAALERARPEGETSLFDGIYSGLLAGLNDPSRNLVLVFSDGVDTASWLSPAQVIETARRSDAVVYALSPKDAGSATFLRDLADQTGGSAFEVDSLQQLASRFVAILEEFRHRYLLSYSPKGVQPGGWHKLEVRVKNRRATVKARPGYVGR